MTAKENTILSRVLKLGLTALATAALCFTTYTLTRRDEVYWLYRCVTQAIRISACFGSGDFDFTADLFGMRYQGNTGNYIDKQIFYLGAYEKPLLFLLRDISKSSFDNQEVFVDVGANTGQHSLFMSRYSREVHAFEPYEPVLARFRRMIEINQIRNIVIHPVGLGNQNVELPFNKPPASNLGAGSFVEGFKPDNSYFGKLEIQIGDEVLEKAGIHSVGIVKIDVEGYEKPALEGLQRTLTKSRPFVVFELTTNPQSTVSIKNKAQLVGLFPDNYEFHVIEDMRGAITGEYKLVSFYTRVHFDRVEQNDIFAYPAEKAHLVRRLIHR